MIAYKMTAQDSKAIRKSLKKANIQKPVSLSTSKKIVYIGRQCGGWMPVEQRQEIAAIASSLGFWISPSDLTAELIDVMTVYKIKN